MLEKLDLSKKVNKEEFGTLMDELSPALGELQRLARAKKIPLLIVFEGWAASGKGNLINEILQSLDPRGFNVYAMGEPTEDELAWPFLRRFWIRLPEEGRIVIFDQSWYRRVLSDRVREDGSDQKWRHAYSQINSFERQLSDQGTLIMKFFLHISHEEQKKRFRSIAKDKENEWRLSEEDYWQHKHYDDYAVAVEEMIEKTDSDFAPWTLVEAHDRRFAVLKIYNKVVQAVKERIAAKEAAQPARKPAEVSSQVIKTLDSSILDKVDVSVTVSDKEYKSRISDLQAEIREMQYRLYSRKIPLIAAFEGWDAAGKGGCIRRLTERMDPRGYDVVPISAPNDLERAHHYLWRFWKAVPKAGEIAIFDRSWYGRVLVERVEGFCSPEDWRRAYHEINEMEEQFFAAGAVIVKFWLHIDPDEQLARFKAREANDVKKWKITAEDWRNREKWAAYKDAVDEMLFRTSTVHAPWTIVEANSKQFARLKVLETVIEAAKERCR